MLVIFYYSKCKKLVVYFQTIYNFNHVNKSIELKFYSRVITANDLALRSARFKSTTLKVRHKVSKIYFILPFFPSKIK